MEARKLPCKLCKPYIQSVVFVNACWASLPFFDPLKPSGNLKLF